MLSTTSKRGGEVTYCCQGVALERYGQALGYDVRRTPYGTLRGSDPQVHDATGSVLIAPRRFWYDMGMLSELSDSLAGLALDVSDRNGTFPVAYSELNDQGFTFNQIADLIEWQFLS